ncbi:HAD family acid phosphatase [Pedococcus sp. KACC 23699]|uniref:HAD family acid phosphatase n=1 Tax=Pedococcus sp. KACC 23699 TaxID=3149228 RepID=A0AAU7JSL1_9MICO
MRPPAQTTSGALKAHRTSRTAVAAGAALLAVAALSSTGAAAASAHDSGEHHGDHHRSDQRLAPRTHFTMKDDGSSGATQGGEGIPNIDSVKKTIYAYYGDPSGTGAASTSSSPYISEMGSILARQRRQLPHLLAEAKHHHAKPAIVFDADDTTLWTYQMEVGDMKFVFTPAAQQPWVDGERFPAVPGMVDFVNDAEKMGFTVFGLTGRTDSQKSHTVSNLAKVGYTAFPSERFFTKFNSGATPPSYLSSSWCSAYPKCTTVEYKAGTRRHIEKDLGYDIVLNVGDQFSDLQGGFADTALKLPNPTYYLPSPNLPGVFEPRLAPRTRFTMAPDGSSGLTQGGEGIPNIDVVKKTIAVYYGDTGSGTSDKTSSPYISEMTRLVAQRSHSILQQCATGARRGTKPAIVLDADDTTLWTYDMEVAAMHFVFDPVVQDQQWVQPQGFPATPAMVSFANAASDAGCTIVGLTGRNTTQRAATLGNLAKVGYTGFTAANYYTKWTSAEQPPSYVTPADCVAYPKCTTIEYKSTTRRHVVDQGYDVVANFGDQFSDLIGGSADRAVKLPNPTYYLP